jgi:hypothetical protein
LNDKGLKSSAVNICPTKAAKAMTSQPNGQQKLLEAEPTSE